MRALLRAHEESGLSLKAFAARAGVPYTTLSRWRGRLRREGPKGLVPVHVRDEALGTDEYVGAAERAGPLRGTLVTASWDANLASPMAAAGRAVHEEQVLGPLLDDLGAAEHGGSTGS